MTAWFSATDSVRIFLQRRCGLLQRNQSHCLKYSRNRIKFSFPDIQVISTKQKPPLYRVVFVLHVSGQQNETQVRREIETLKNFSASVPDYRGASFVGSSPYSSQGTPLSDDKHPVRTIYVSNELFNSSLHLDDIVLFASHPHFLHIAELTQAAARFDALHHIVFFGFGAERKSYRRKRDLWPEDP